MILDEADRKLVDFLIDDYFALWELCSYFSQTLKDHDPIAAREQCQSRLRRYIEEDLVEVFVGRMSKNNFHKIGKIRAKELLSKESSWTVPTGAESVVAVTTTDKGKASLGLSGS